MIDKALGPVTLTGYVFNGDVDVDSDNTLQNYGVRIAISDLEEDGWTLNLDHISNIADADGIQPEDPMDLLITNAVSGCAISASVALGPLLLGAEFIQTDEFELDLVTNPIPSIPQGAKLSAFYFDASVEVDMFGNEGSASAAYNKTDDAVALELPETRISLGVSVELTEISWFSVELAHNEDYDQKDSGSGASAWNIAIQTTIEI